MEQLLRDIGLPAGLVIVVALLAFLAREAWSLLKAGRLNAAQNVFSTMLQELDRQIGEFYLPIKQRLKVSHELFLATREWLGEDGRFRNDAVGVESSDPKALSKIVVQQMLLPLNTEVERILLEKLHLRAPDDPTDYAKLLKHFIQWRSFEQAEQCEKISSYKGKSFLQFPADEAEKQKAACEAMLRRREEIRAKILRLENVYSKWF